MSWEKLNNHELQAIRKMLMLDVSEAAEFIGKVSQRTWQYWESGRSAVPDDIDIEMYGLIQRRNELVESILSSLEESDKIPYYHSFEEWEAAKMKGNKVEWKLWQSAVAEVFTSHADIELC